MVNFDQEAYDLDANPEAEDVSIYNSNLNKASESKDGGVLLAGQQSEEDRDAKSVFVKNVHYNADKKEIEEHFADCGEIKLITICMNKMTH